jgi:hypothetical protein
MTRVLLRQDLLSYGFDIRYQSLWGLLTTRLFIIITLSTTAFFELVCI